VDTVTYERQLPKAPPGSKPSSIAASAAAPQLIKARESSEAAATARAAAARGAAAESGHDSGPEMVDAAPLESEKAAVLQAQVNGMVRDS
jgi:hypothetical protein